MFFPQIIVLPGTSLRLVSTPSLLNLLTTGNCYKKESENPFYFVSHSVLFVFCSRCRIEQLYMLMGRDLLPGCRDDDDAADDDGGGSGSVVVFTFYYW